MEHVTIYLGDEDETIFRFNMEELIRQRELFEYELYDYLVTPDIIIPSTFWDPVIVSFNGVENLENIVENDCCLICSEETSGFKKLNCCNQKMCKVCCNRWFNISVKCPYCYQDIREFNLKKCD